MYMFSTLDVIGCLALVQGLPDTLGSWMDAMLFLITTLVVIALLNPPFILPLLFVVWRYNAIRNEYLASSRVLQRLDGAGRAPVLSHLVESLEGAASIHCGGLREAVVGRCQRLVDHSLAIYHALSAANRWMGFRLDLLGAGTVLVAALLIVQGRHHSGLAASGLALAYCLRVTQSLSFGIRSSATLENQFNAVERILQLTGAPREAAWEKSPAPAPTWPAQGHVSFEQVSVVYRPGLAPAIDAVSLTLAPGEHVGLCGRTGSGKTTLVSALFRVVELASGRITIDGLDIAGLGLHALRRRLGVVTQEPVLFLSTLRACLDPLREHSDAELSRVLALVHMGHRALDAPPDNGISAGERQV